MDRRIFTGLAVVSVACGGARPAEAPPSPTLQSPPVSSTQPPAAAAARFVHPPYLATDRFVEFEQGRLAAVHGGRRILIAGGKTRVIDDAVVEDLGRAIFIPRALGGGVLFVGVREIYFAPTYDGALKALGEVPELTQVGFGYRQVLLMPEAGSARIVALPSGAPVTNDKPRLSKLFGAPSGVVAAVDDKGKLYVSTPAARDWKALMAPPVESLRFDGTNIVVDAKNLTLQIDPSGKLGPPKGGQSMIVADNGAAFSIFGRLAAAEQEPKGVEWLNDNLTQRMSAKVALAIRDQALYFIEASTGNVSKTLPTAFANKFNCFFIRGGTPSFVGCNGDGEGPPNMELLRIEGEGKAPVSERTFPGAYSQDFGMPGETSPLVFPGKCDGERMQDVLCVRTKDGRWHETKMADPQGLLGQVSRLIGVGASEDEKPYGFSWGEERVLLILDGAQKRIRKVPRSAMPSWASVGVNWHAMTIVDGTIRFLFAPKGSGTFSAGVVEIRPDDEVVGTKFDGDLAPYRERALLRTPSGQLRETLDAGRTFHDVPSPPGGAGHELLHCMATGCVVGPWFRAGWSHPQD
ncbi:MAG: hypothetical protein R3B13_12685 [Polyangiaceae bacterium]